jgi:prepilin-type N-terminal cleavage/methylation domain-containing protein
VGHAPLHLNETIVRINLTRHNAGAMRQETVGRPGRERHRQAARPGERAGANESNALQRRPDEGAFTLIELLVVIAIIAILIGMLFPAFRAVQNQAKQTQAKNDLTQIVTAVNAYYTEYGKYPLVTSDTTITSTTTPSTADLFYTLRAIALGANASDVANPRKIVFIAPPDAKNPANPRSGIATQTVTVNGISIPAGSFVDPWGPTSGRAGSGIYHVTIDGGYDNQVANPYTSNAGATPNLQIGVIAWSLGADGVQGTDFKASDDVISWQ